MIEVLNRLRRAITKNALFSSLYRFVGNGTPIQIGDNPSEYIEFGYAGNADVYSIINRICVYARNVGLVVQKMEGDEWVNQPDNIIQALLDYPNDQQGKAEFFDKLYASLQTTGNAFIYKLRLGDGLNAGRIAELHVMPADKVEIVASNNPLKPIRGYRVEGYFQETIPASDVIHIRFANLTDSSGTGSELYGMSPLKPARKLLTQSNDTYTANMKALQNNGAVGLLTGESNEDYDPAQLQAIQDRYEQKYAGPSNRGKTIISSKPLKWVNMGISPKDLMTFEGQQVSLKHLCNVFNVPLALFNSDASTFNNVSEAKKSMYADCIIPLVQYVVDELNRDLHKELGGAKIWVETNDIEALQSDKLAKVQWMRAAGVFTQAEIREALEYAAIEGDALLEAEMEEIYIPSNLKPLGSEPQIPNPPANDI